MLLEGVRQRKDTFQNSVIKRQIRRTGNRVSSPQAIEDFREVVPNSDPWASLITASAVGSSLEITAVRKAVARTFCANHRLCW